MPCQVRLEGGEAVALLEDGAVGRLVLAPQLVGHPKQLGHGGADLVGELDKPVCAALVLSFRLFLHRLLELRGTCGRGVGFWTAGVGRVRVVCLMRDGVFPNLECSGCRGDG